MGVNIYTRLFETEFVKVLKGSILTDPHPYAERPRMLRVVRCLPPDAGLSVSTSTQQVGVLRASREETAARSDAVMEGNSAMGI